MLRGISQLFSARKVPKPGEYPFAPLHSIHFLVKDLDTSVDFYNRLGLPVTQHSDWSNSSLGGISAHTAILDLGNGASLALSEPSDPYGIELIYTMPDDRCTQLGFIVANLDAFYQAASANGISFLTAPQDTRNDDGAGGRSLFCNDPDGYGIIIFERHS